MAEHDVDVTPINPEEHRRDTEEAGLFLDATIMRSRIDFDPEFAQSVVDVVSKAAQIVEESRSIDQDKPPPLHSLAAYNKLLRQRRLELYNATAAHEAARLKQRIAQEAAEIQRIAAETPPLHWAPSHLEPEERLQDTPAASSPSRDEGLSPGRVFVIGGLPVATTAVGAVLLVESAISSPMTPNPYIALFVFLAGLALAATAVAALRERRRS